jgi:hypothetical protein
VALTLAFAGGWWLRAHGLSVAEFQNELGKGSEPRFDWRSVDKKHWQALGRAGVTPTSTTDELPELTDAREGNSAGCTTGMVRVKGNFRLDLHGEATGEIERIQDGACTDWISKEFPARCRTFDREKIAEEVAKLPTRPLDFCMDRFEYPNVLGQNPVIVVTFHEAEALCKKSKKRLCTENEWTFACEGDEVRPYPQGWTRDSTACVVDRSWRPFAEGALSPRDGPVARSEVDRLWQAEPSGSRAACKSPFGVYDMTGNVDEWTRSARTTGFSSILKGGYWGPVRARCRPATRAHNEDFVAYQQGFRCCSDSNASVPAPKQIPVTVPEPPRSTPPVAVPGKRGPGTTAELEWTHEPPDDKDEVEAIGRARVGPACAVARAAGAPSPSTSLFGLGALAALGMSVLRGSRDRGSERRAPSGDGASSAPIRGATRRPRVVRRPG